MLTSNRSHAHDRVWFRMYGLGTQFRALGLFGGGLMALPALQTGPPIGFRVSVVVVAVLMIWFAEFRLRPRGLYATPRGLEIVLTWRRRSIPWTEAEVFVPVPIGDRIAVDLWLRDGTRTRVPAIEQQRRLIWTGGRPVKDPISHLNEMLRTRKSGTSGVPVGSVDQGPGPVGVFHRTAAQAPGASLAIAEYRSLH